MTTTQSTATATAARDATTRYHKTLALAALLLSTLFAPTDAIAQTSGDEARSAEQVQSEPREIGLTNEQLVERQLALAQHFYQLGQYFRAIGAFEEAAYFTERSDRALTAEISVAMAYQRAGEHQSAVQAYDAVLSRKGLSQDLGGYLRVQRTMARTDGWLERGPDETTPDVLIGELEPIARRTSAPFRFDAQYQLARLHLLDRDRESARMAADALERDCLDVDDTSAPCQSIRKLQKGLANEPPKHRSPALGLILSTLVPGAGSAYAGHYVDGLYYLGLTGFGGWISYELYEPGQRFADQRASFYTVGTITALIYTANIVRGWTASARFNAVERENYRREIYRKTRIPMPLERR